MEAIRAQGFPTANGHGQGPGQGQGGERCGRDYGFQMPLNYPRYSKEDYETMPEWQLDRLFSQYGLPAVSHNLEQKRSFAMGAFLWPAL